MNRSKQAGMATKTIIVLLVSLILASVQLAEAQQPKKVPQIGFLSSSSPSAVSARLEAFRQGLRELGYVEGKNIIIEYRFAEGMLERLPDLTAELVSSRVHENPFFVCVRTQSAEPLASRL